MNEYLSSRLLKKNSLAVLILLLLSGLCYSQKLRSGTYDYGMFLAYDSTTNRLSGYFESYGGWDESMKEAKFSCIFYIEGTVADTVFEIMTYYPNETADSIKGTMEIVNDRSVNIRLNDDHGGCGNVQNFSSEKLTFTLIDAYPWKEVRFITVDKSYFHSEPKEDKKQKAYLVKSDFVCIEKTKGKYAYCTYFGDKTTTGWIKITDLNKR